VGAVLVLSVPPAAAAPGELDASFGVGGVVTSNFGGTYDWAYATALQHDGRILAAGVSNAKGTYDFALARYTSDHALDPSFGEGGLVLTDFGQSYDWAYALAVQPDGKIVVGGVSNASGSRDFALARYNPDGSLDRWFGQNGRVVSELRPLTTDTVHGLALQPDGKIVAAGMTFDEKVSLGPQSDFMLARYDPDGRLDPTFGIAGVLITDFGGRSYDELHALALQPDGKLVVAGYSNSGGGPGVLYGADNLALARYTPSGLLDDTFGHGGKVTVDAWSLDEELRAVAVAPDGRIVAAGFRNGEKGGDFVVLRLNPDGVLDPTFGLTFPGYTVTDLGTHAERLTSLALASDGRIVAGGVVARDHHADFAVARYDADGRLDPSFGRDGLVTVDFEGREDRVQGLALQRDGKIVAVGLSEHDFALARLSGS
jgi:uncharacterized delta-60 repeat protein